MMRRVAFCCFVFIAWAVCGWFPGDRSAVARAQQAPACMPLAAFTASLADGGGWGEPNVLTGEAAKKAVDIYNAMPPESDNVFNTVVLVEYKDGRGIVVFGNDGLMCYIVAFDANHWRIFVRSVIGTVS